jgi:hypothetical protein
VIACIALERAGGSDVGHLHTGGDAWYAALQSGQDLRRSVRLLSLVAWAVRLQLCPVVILRFEQRLDDRLAGRRQRGILVEDPVAEVPDLPPGHGQWLRQPHSIGRGVVVERAGHAKADEEERCKARPVVVALLDLAIHVAAAEHPEDRAVTVGGRDDIVSAVLDDPVGRREK